MPKRITECKDSSRIHLQLLQGVTDCVTNTRISMLDGEGLVQNILNYQPGPRTMFPSVPVHPPETLRYRISRLGQVYQGGTTSDPASTWFCFGHVFVQ